MEVVEAGPEDRPAMEALLRRHNAHRVARAGELLDASMHPALVAWSNGDLVGAATYVIDGDHCELVTLHADERFRGVGSALLAALHDIARDAGCARLVVTTTNDNLDALRFYQRRGFRLARLRPGAVDESRARLKPEIPDVGSHGIPLRDELELEMVLTDDHP